MTANPKAPATSTRLGVQGLFLVSVAVTMAGMLWIRSLPPDPLALKWESIFRYLFLYEDYWLAAGGCVVLALALAPGVRAASYGLLRWLDKNIAVAALLYFVLLSMGAFFVYHAHPLSMDEYAQHFQSVVFASGSVAGQIPAELVDWVVPPVFQSHFLSVSPGSGRIVSSYWPSFALLMTPFTALGVPWLCNPVLGAASVLLIHRLGSELFPRTDAGALAALLTMASPAFFTNSISFYSMTAHLTLNAAFTLCLLKPTMVRAFIAGVIGSIALTLHNPFPHVLYAIPWVVRLSWSSNRLKLIAVLAGGYLPLTLVLGLGWAIFKEGIAPSGLLDSQDGSSAWRLQSVFAAPNAALLYARLAATFKLWVWAVPTCMLFACVGAWLHRRNDRVTVLSASALLTFVGYLFVVFHQGHGWGYRYFHSAWLTLPLLAAGAFALPGTGAAASNRRLVEVKKYVSACAMLSGLILIPFNSFQVHRFISRHLEQEPQAMVGGPHVTFISASGGYYSIDLVQNDPFLRGPMLRLLSRGHEKDAELIRERFPDMVLLVRDPRGSVYGPAPQERAAE